MAQTAYTHTPGPWRFDNDPSSFSYGDVVSDVPGETRSTIIAQMKWRDGEVNADFIVRACNAHDELLGLLKEAANFIQPFNRAEELLDRIDGAIAKASGGPA